MRALLVLCGLLLGGCARLPLQKSLVDPAPGPYEDVGSCRPTMLLTVLGADGLPVAGAQVHTVLMAVNPLSSRVWRFKGGPTATNEQGEARVCDPRGFAPHTGTDDDGLRAKVDTAVAFASTANQEGMIDVRGEGPFVVTMRAKQ